MKLFLRLTDVFFLLCLTVLSAQAATYTVTNANDSGAGSLRQAILNAEANAGADVINVMVIGTVALQSGLPLVTQSLTINGGGQTQGKNRAVCGAKTSPCRFSKPVNSERLRA